MPLFLISCSKTEDRTPSTAQVKHAAKYHCPMHPTYVSDKPGSCPICGMTLVPIDEDTGSPAGTNASGRTAIHISPERQQQIGVVTAPVERRNLSRTIRATATVEYDERRWTQVSPRIGGWVQELYIDCTGKPVEEGQPLLKLYSPELLVTEKEYLNAVKSRDESLIASSKRRLQLWSISDAQIADLEKTGQASDTMDLVSPASGYVIKKNVTKGQAIMPGQTLYEIADLSHVWFHTFVFEQEIADIHTGQHARITLPYRQGKTYDAQVMFIFPNIEQETRTLEVRLEADNPDMALRPDMWANVEIDIALGEGLAIPASAVIDTGKRLVAFVDKGDGRLEPREIKVTGKTDDYYQVGEGVAEGEKVVTRALFLVDAESQLKAAISGM